LIEEKITEYVDMVLAQYEADPENPYNVVSVDVETGFAGPIPDDYPIDLSKIFLRPYGPYTVLVSVQLSHAPREGALIPLWHKDSPFKDYASICMVATQLQRLLDVVPVIGQNYKFDFQVIYTMLGVVAKKFVFDSMLAHFLMYQKTTSLALEDLAGKYCGMPKFKREMNKALATLPEGKRHMGYVDLEKLIRYGCGDCDAVFRYYKHWRPIMEEQGFLEVYQTILQDATSAIAWMEINGMAIDPERLKKLKEDYPKELAELMGEIRDSDYVKDIEFIRREDYDAKKAKDREEENEKREKEGKPPVRIVNWSPEVVARREKKLTEKLAFNPGSSDQLRKLFYDPRLMGFDPNGKGVTKNKQPSADKDARRMILEDANAALNKLVEKVEEERESKRDQEEIEDLTSCIELIENIGGWTGKNKLYSAYVKGADTLIYNKGDIKRKWPIPYPDECCEWCFHANFKIHDGTDTGRLSCEWPNLQQMPYKSLIKWMFISRWKKIGGILLQADYSQAELRVLATLCDERAMLDAFNRGEDIHMFVAGLLFGALGYSKDEITKDMRKIAKNATFGIIYGQGARALAYKFGTTVDEAKKIIRTIYKIFPNLRQWMNEKVEECKDHGLVTTPMGRIRWIDGATSRDEYTAAAAARKAVNTPIQSAASDWTLCSLNEIVKNMLRKGYKSLPVATIHDSVMIDVYPGEMLEIIDLIHKEMVKNLPERFNWIDVLPKAEFDFGVDWMAFTEISVLPDLTYKIKGNYKDIKKNMRQLMKAGGDIEQVDADFNLEKPDESWLVADLIGV
jgi:DNA polymerase I-like protein with 3'-5' exonuclease and polymerase domains